MTLFLRALVIGLAIAAPVGPIGILCIRRTLERGQAIGFATGLGAATADMLYGAIAAFGLTAVTHWLIAITFWLRLCGGIFLIYLGVTIMRTPFGAKATDPRGKGLVGAYFSTLGLTLTNPATIFSFIAIFAGLGLGTAGYGRADALQTVGGIFLGSALWWLILSSGVHVLRQRFAARELVWVNRLAGIVIMVFGVVALVSIWHR